MCRYASSGPYKRHFVCFDCRKAFKQPPIDDYFASRGQKRNCYAELAEVWRTGNKAELERRQHELGARLEELEKEYRAAVRKCPECGSAMIDMGLDFKTPRQTDAKAWRILKGMYTTGHAFHGCGCDGPGWIPKSTADYREFLVNCRSNYSVELGKVEKRNDLATERKLEAAKFWSNQIAKVDNELEKLK